MNPSDARFTSGKHTTTSASLRTDLAIARDQIKTLRAERDKLQQRLRLHLGAEIEAPDRAHLTARVADLEALNRRLVAERDARMIEADTAKRRVADLEDELIAARESLRRVIKSQNGVNCLHPAAHFTRVRGRRGTDPPLKGLQP